MSSESTLKYQVSPYYSAATARSMAREWAQPRYCDQRFQEATSAIIGSVSDALAKIDPDFSHDGFVSTFLDAIRYEQAQWTDCQKESQEANENLCEDICGDKYINPAGECICVNCLEINAVNHARYHDL